MNVTSRPVPRAEQVGSLKRPARLIAANEAVYKPGHVAIEEAERAHGPVSYTHLPPGASGPNV